MKNEETHSSLAILHSKFVIRNSTFNIRERCPRPPFARDARDDTQWREGRRRVVAVGLTVTVALFALPHGEVTRTQNCIVAFTDGVMNVGELPPTG